MDDMLRSGSFIASSGSKSSTPLVVSTGPFAPHGSNFLSRQLGPAQVRRLCPIHCKRLDSARLHNYPTLRPHLLGASLSPSGKLGPDPVLPLPG